jgi:formimidoylglutamate deiminase
MGWLPDCVYTGEKFETGLAFFADGLGRISRFSREPADLAVARRLPGQAALPGLVNAHSHAFHRTLRGRGELRGRTEHDAPPAASEAHDRVAARLSGEDYFDAARMAFLEMMLSGITCVGEFHYLRHQADGSPWPDPNFLAGEILRAAHDVGIRLALLHVGATRVDPAAASSGLASARVLAASAERFVRETESLRVYAEKNYPGDEAWIGVAALGVGALSLDELRVVGNYAHTQRLRLHVQLPVLGSGVDACVREHGRRPVALLGELGWIDKRFTAVHGAQLNEDEVKLLGAARAIVCACPTAERNSGLTPAPVAELLAAGAGVALGSDRQAQINLLADARLLDYALRVTSEKRGVLTPDPAPVLFHAATVTGARSLGATGGALEVGRPADFFTVNLYDPSLAGSDAGTLLSNVVFSLERRAIRDVWIGARLKIANGRHVDQGGIVGRFVEVQQRLWA